MTDLRAAYEALCQPRRVVYHQINSAGLPYQTETALESVMQMLRDAVVGGIGSKGAAGDGKARLPFDVGALTLYDEIEDQSGEWLYAVARRVPAESPERNLAEWIDAFEQLPHPRTLGDHNLEAFYLAKLVGWEKRVHAMFNPPKTRDITESYYEPIVDDFGVQRTRRKLRTERVGLDIRRYYERVPMFHKTTRPAACPQCGERWAFERAYGDRITALIVEYRLTDDELTLKSIDAACRFCASKWPGQDGVQRLNDAIDERRTEADAMDRTNGVDNRTVRA